MACALQAVIAAANTCTFPTQRFFHSKYHSVSKRSSSLFFTVRASTEEDPDCNDEECAPDKEVGKISGEWLAGEKTRVVGTYPPRKKGWTGYVEKDTAGQTNIYSVEEENWLIRENDKISYPHSGMHLMVSLGWYKHDSRDEYENTHGNGDAVPEADTGGGQRHRWISRGHMSKRRREDHRPKTVVRPKS
nr:hypothetical protein CFP56_74215 [Quercus suber]